MTLENICCSFELAKKLQELGVKNNSIFHWTNEDILLMPNWKKWKITNAKGLYPKAEYISAYTIGELGEMLPSFIYIGEKKNKKTYKLYLAKNKNNEWFVEYHEWNLKRAENYELLVQRNADTEADAKAEMLCFLLENKLINL